MAVLWRILACLLLPLIWGVAVELIFERLRRRRATKAAGGEPGDTQP